LSILRKSVPACCLLIEQVHSEVCVWWKEREPRPHSESDVLAAPGADVPEGRRQN
jgi:hypothetical protein